MSIKQDSNYAAVDDKIDLTIATTNQTTVSQTYTWSEIPIRLIRFMKNFRPNHIYSTALLIFQLFILVSSPFLQFCTFHSHASRQYYSALRTFATGAVQEGTKMFFQSDINHLKEYDDWLFAAIITLWLLCATSLAAIFTGIFCDPCAPLLLSKIRSCGRASKDQKIEADTTGGSPLLSIDSSRTSSVRNSPSCLTEEAHITEEQQLINNQQLKKNFATFHVFLLLVFFLQSVFLQLFMISLWHLFKLAIVDQIDEEILNVIESSAERNPQGFSNIEKTFACCGYAMKFGGINFAVGECQNDDETVSCTQKITSQLMSTAEMAICVPCLICVVASYVFVIYECRSNILKEVKLKIEKNNSKILNLEAQPQETSEPDPANVNTTAVSYAERSEPAVMSNSQIVVSAEVHAVEEDTLKSIEYLTVQPENCG